MVIRGDQEFEACSGDDDRDHKQCNSKIVVSKRQFEA